MISNDHSGFCYHGARGKRLHGEDVPFSQALNGIPGVGARLPLMFSEGVAAGRITASESVALTGLNPARLCGLHHKRRIAPGADADIALWYPECRSVITNASQQHAIDYPPYEGKEITGLPVLIIRRGEIVMENGAASAKPGSRRFLPVGPYDFIQPAGTPPDGLDAAAWL